MSTRTQKIITSLLIVLLTISIFTISGWVFYIYDVVKTFDTVFAQHVYIEDIPIGGMTFEEAEKSIQDYIEEQISTCTVTLQSEDTAYTMTLEELRGSYEVERVLYEAFQVGHTGNLFERYQVAQYGLIEPQSFELFPIYTQEGIEEGIRVHADVFHKAPVDATIERRNRQFITTAEQEGYALAVSETAKRIKETLDVSPDQAIEIEVVLEPRLPQTTLALLETVQSPIASFYTSYNNADSDRNRNLALAAKKINKVLLPDAVFSLGEQLEPITFEEGYRPSKVIVNGQLEEGIGGGVCQIASTLYNAVLLSDLEIVTRANHSLPVAYVPLGRDATYASESIDFKFKNASEYPVFIESYCESNRVYVNIFSHETLKEDYDDIKFESQLVETDPAPAPKIIKDDTLYVDEHIQEVTPLEGKTIKLYKLGYKDGSLVHKELVNTSYYRKRGAVIREGTKPRPVEPVEDPFEGLLN